MQSARFSAIFSWQRTCPLCATTRQMASHSGWWNPTMDQQNGCPSTWWLLSMEVSKARPISKMTWLLPSGCLTQNRTDMLYEAMSLVLKGRLPRVPLKRRKRFADRLGLEESEVKFSKEIPFSDIVTACCQMWKSVLECKINLFLRHTVLLSREITLNDAFKYY